jgi:UDP-N-acetylmuramoyl-tripeptide--D-alanyl-D-alanine ligase
MVKMSELLDAHGIIRYENLDNDRIVTGGRTDSRQILSGDIYFALKGQNSDGHDFIAQAFEKKMSAAVVSADYINNSCFPVIYSKDVEKTLGGIANIWRKMHSAKIIGITGTNGKTTTKEMLAGILSNKFRLISTFKNYNNQIGVPLTLLSIKEDTEVAIVELGTNHFGEIKYLSEISDPDLGIITNIGEGHLEFLRDKSGVFEEKKELFEHINKRGGKIFVNTDDEYLRSWKNGNITTFGFTGTPDIKFENVIINENGFPEFRFKNIPAVMNVPGKLNLKNALAAAALADELGVPPEKITESLRSYKSSDKRYELVRFNNSQILLDCYNANPTSMEYFLNDISAMGRDFSVILGDMLELGSTSSGSHNRIADLAESLGFSQVLLYGSEMKSAFIRRKFKGSVSFYESFDQRKEKFIELTAKGGKIAVKGSRGMKLEKLME